MSLVWPQLHLAVAPRGGASVCEREEGASGCKLPFELDRHTKHNTLLAGGRKVCASSRMYALLMKVHRWPSSLPLSVVLGVAEREDGLTASSARQRAWLLYRGRGGRCCEDAAASSRASFVWAGSYDAVASVR